VRVINSTETIPLGRAGGRSVEAVVRTTGVDARVHGRGFRFERREPQAIVLRGEDDVTRMALPAGAQNAARVAAPVAAYLLTRAFVRRRRKT
jgi:hypothetical protein